MTTTELYGATTVAPVDPDPLEDVARALLTLIGEDPDRDGLRDTPRRYARWWREFIDYDPGTVTTSFETVQVDQMVAVSGVRVWSLCEHHLLPFSCDLTIAYITRERVLGLSKFARVAHRHAHGLQVQERLVNAVADEIGQLTGSPDVAVFGKGEHLCMTMRGIKTAATMHSSVLRGLFKDDPRSRMELFELTRS